MTHPLHISFVSLCGVHSWRPFITIIKSKVGKTMQSQKEAKLLQAQEMLPIRREAASPGAAEAPKYQFHRASRAQICHRWIYVLAGDSEEG